MFVVSMVDYLMSCIIRYSQTEIVFRLGGSAVMCGFEIYGVFI